MAKAYGALSEGASSAAERLASSKDKPTGKLGSAALTVKIRNKFTEYRSQNPETDIKWEDWLEQNGYGLGDNNHVYRK